jgi:hypothetical protein
MVMESSCSAQLSAAKGRSVVVRNHEAISPPAIAELQSSKPENNSLIHFAN